MKPKSAGKMPSIPQSVSAAYHTMAHLLLSGHRLTPSTSRKVSIVEQKGQEPQKATVEVATFMATDRESGAEFRLCQTNEKGDPTILITYGTEPELPKALPTYAATILATMLALGAVRREHRTTKQKISDSLKLMDAGNLAHDLSAIAKAGFAERQAGRKGGVWLTGKGRKLAELLPKQ